MFLDKLREWRNDTSHNAPTASEKEIDAALQVVVAMYLYVTGNSITDLESAGYDADSTSYYKMNIAEDNQIPMAAEQPKPYGED